MNFVFTKWLRPAYAGKKMQYIYFKFSKPTSSPCFLSTHFMTASKIALKYVFGRKKLPLFVAVTGGRVNEERDDGGRERVPHLALFHSLPLKSSLGQWNVPRSIHGMDTAPLNESG